MSIVTRNKLKEAMKGTGECKTVKAGKRMQYNWRDSSYKGSDPLGDTIELMKHSGNNIILDFICAENGGVFVKNVEADDSKKTLHQDQSSIICEVADVIKVLTDSCADGEISPKEIDKMTREFDELAQAFYGFIQSAEKGKR